MAYDEELADRIRRHFGDDPALTEQKMFGGLCFMLGGNMCVGVTSEDMMVRVGREGYEDALAQPGAREMDFTGRPMTTMVYVDQSALASDNGLAEWVDRGAAFARSLPPKR